MRVRALLWLMLTASLGGVAANLYMYQRDQRWIVQYATSVPPLPADTTAKALALGQYIRDVVRVDGAPHDGRPVLRASAREALQDSLGYCGEATRAYIALARTQGLRARRALLYGRAVNHVVPEVQVAPDRWVLVDIQHNAVTNALLDAAPLTADQLLAMPGTPFAAVSNINLRRVPLLASSAATVRLDGTRLSWFLESPTLMRAAAFLLLAFGLLAAIVAMRRPRGAEATL